MAVTDSALIGIIVAGSVAGVFLVVVFAIVTVYCYRSLDHSDDRKLMRKKKRALLYAEAMSGPLYYADTTSSGGTTARLVPPPALYGHVDGGYHSATTTMEVKRKHKKSRPSHQNSPRSKYGEREGHMEFQEEHQGSNPGSVKGDNSTPISPEPYGSEVPVIVTYLGDPVKRVEETNVKTVLDEDTPKVRVSPPDPPPLPDGDVGQASADHVANGEQKSNEESEPEEGSEAYLRRQREPPKGDIGPPAKYFISGEDTSVLY